MKDKFLDEEIEAFGKLEDAGFSEVQIDAIYKYVEFKLKYQNEWRDAELSDAKIEMKQALRKHGHLNGKVVSEL